MPRWPVMTEPETVRNCVLCKQQFPIESFWRDGASEAFIAIAELAMKVGRIPIGEWAYGPFKSDERYWLWVNGGAEMETRGLRC